MLSPFFTLCLALLAAPPEAKMTEEPKIDPARMVTFERQTLAVPDFKSDGLILDIGGGGEGVIGQLKGAQVVAIDLYDFGMRRTPPGPLKLVMDATDLKFLDGSFGTVTSFFTLMYMTPDKQEKAFHEAFRVLKPGGCMRIWEVELPVSPDPKKDVAVYPFTFELPGTTIQTGYGTFFPRAPLGLPHYVKLARDAGFSVEDQTSEGRTLRLLLRRP